MNEIVRSIRFNYNENYDGPRFYTFSTWADDITKYFSTSSGIVIAPSAFLAFKSEVPVSTIMPYLENYFENKLAFAGSKYFTNSNCDSNELNMLLSQYSPLKYLLDLLYYIGAVNDDTDWIYEDITEQNYNGSFTDFLCTIPHGYLAKKISNIRGCQESLISRNHKWSKPEFTINEYSYKCGSITEYDNIYNLPGRFPSVFDWSESDEPALVEDGSAYYISAKTLDGMFNVRFIFNMPKTINRIEGKRICEWTHVNTMHFRCGEKIILESNNNLDIIKVVLASKTEPSGPVLIDNHKYNWEYNTESNTWVVEYCEKKLDLHNKTITIEFLGLCDIYKLDIEDRKTTYTTIVTNGVSIEDNPVGWDRLYVDILYDLWRNGSGDYNYLIGDNTKIVFENTDKKSVAFNCIIPLYKEFNPEKPDIKLGTSNNILELLVFKPLGIWFNGLDDTGELINIELKTGTISDKYTSSWSLSVSTQIKPFYASNSIPVKYSDAASLDKGVNTFAAAISKVNELSYTINNFLKNDRAGAVTDFSNKTYQTKMKFLEDNMLGLSDKLTQMQKDIDLLKAKINECV